MKWNEFSDYAMIYDFTKVSDDCFQRIDDDKTYFFWQNGNVLIKEGTNEIRFEKKSNGEMFMLLRFINHKPGTWKSEHKY